MLSSKNKLNHKDVILLNIQKFFAWLTIPLWYMTLVFWMRIVKGYKIKDIKKIREQYRKLLSCTSSPILICPNHLTKIDSIIIQWGFCSLRSCLVNFKQVAWNLPEKERYYRNPFLRLLCYLGCCIPVSRGGNRETVNNSLDKIKYMLNTSHIAMIFPEGKRSATGRVDTKEYAYGVGRLVQALESCNVLCVYMRGRSQKSKSNYPAYGDKFYFDMKMIAPSSTHKRARATKDIASQIINQLCKMEETYFEFSWK